MKRWEQLSLPEFTETTNGLQRRATGRVESAGRVPRAEPGEQPGLYLSEAFWARVRVRPYGCWVWTGPVNSSGYGSVRSRGRWLQVHVLVWRTYRGSYVMPGRELDHLCSNRRCCRPGHLEVVTHAENLRRARARARSRGRPPHMAAAPEGDRGRITTGYRLSHQGSA